MKFTKEQLNKFKVTWKKETGNNLSDKKAHLIFESIVKLMIPIYSDIL